MKVLRETDKDLLLEYTHHSGAIHVRKYEDGNRNSSDEINQKARESLKKILDTLLSIDSKIKIKSLWY